MSTRCEVADVAMALARELPEGIEVRGAREVALRCASPDQEIGGFIYRIDIRTLRKSGIDIDAAMAAYAAADELIVRRHTKRGFKEVNAAPLISRFERDDQDHLDLEVRFSEKGSVKPSDILAAVFEIDTSAARAVPCARPPCFRVVPTADKRKDRQSSPHRAKHSPPRDSLVQALDKGSDDKTTTPKRIRRTSIHPQAQIRLQDVQFSGHPIRRQNLFPRNPMLNSRKTRG